MYNEAAANLPQLLIMLSFGDPVLNSSLKAFLEHLVLAEELLTRKDRRMTDKVVFKDRGPLLYWLANECPLPASLQPRLAPRHACLRAAELLCAPSLSVLTEADLTVARHEASTEQRREFAVLLTSLHAPEESNGHTPTGERTEEKTKRSMSTLMKSDAWNKIIPRRFSGVDAAHVRGCRGTTPIYLHTTRPGALLCAPSCMPHLYPAFWGRRQPATLALPACTAADMGLTSQE